MFALGLLALVASVHGFGYRACSRSSNYFLNGSPNGNSSLIPANLKIAFMGDNNNANTLRLVLSEGAEAVVHAGDFDYSDDPDLWEDQINAVLGRNFPFYSSAGNHDVDAWSGYHQYAYERLTRTGLAAQCNGDIGIDYTCSYKGVLLLGSAVGTCSYSDSSHVNYINTAFSKWGSAWKLCHWHKNQRLYQTGGKSDETGYEILDACRQNGGIVVTGHEHSYARTFEMSHFEDFQYDNTKFNPTIRSETATQDGTSFLFVTGLGGESIRGWESGLQSRGWWAATASADGCTGPCLSNGVGNRATGYGVMFGVFNYNGNRNQARFYFKDTNGRTFDDFIVTTAVGDAPTVVSTLSCASPFVEVPVSASADDRVLPLRKVPGAQAISSEGVIVAEPEWAVELTFRNLALTAADRFQGAWLQVFSEEAGEGEGNVEIRAVHNGETTKNVVTWIKEGEEWERHTVWVSADLSTLLAEIIAKPSWTAGDSITLVLLNHGQPRVFRTLDFGLRYAPTLAYELVSPCA